MTEATTLCQAGQDMPKAMPLSESASAATGRVVAKASSDVADDQQRQHAELDPPGADPVDGRAARADHQQPHQRRQPEQQPDVAEREVAHLVEVDDVERQHQTGAEELQHHDREQQPALAGEVAPEAAETGGGGRGGHRVDSRSDHRQSAPDFRGEPQGFG